MKVFVASFWENPENMLEPNIVHVEMFKLYSAALHLLVVLHVPTHLMKDVVFF